MTAGVRDERGQPFEVESVDQDGVRVIHAHGEIDIATAPELAGHLHEAGGAAPAVVVDLCDVAFMDSTGISTLLEARRQFLEGGIGLALACAPDSASARVLGVAGVDRVFEIHEDRASAIAALKDDAS